MTPEEERHHRNGLLFKDALEGKLPASPSYTDESYRRSQAFDQIAPQEEIEDPDDRPGVPNWCVLLILGIISLSLICIALLVLGFFADVIRALAAMLGAEG